MLVDNFIYYDTFEGGALKSSDIPEFFVFKVEGVLLANGILSIATSVLVRHIISTRGCASTSTFSSLSTSISTHVLGQLTNVAHHCHGLSRLSTRVSLTAS